jgi:quinol monooxygenase YgiN
MIKRIVRMEMKAGKEARFLDIFEDAKDEIRSRKGCMGLELFQSSYEGRTTLWTISSWESDGDLESYRSSELFQKTWSAVKPLFSERAQAWTLTPIEILP